MAEAFKKSSEIRERDRTSNSFLVGKEINVNVNPYLDY
jgi:hypothetical protein